jgi:hypothetical protein
MSEREDEWNDCGAQKSHRDLEGNLESLHLLWVKKE